MQTSDPFEIDINGLVMKATGYIINNDEVFRIEFACLSRVSRRGPCAAFI
jgi:hypothetical protein